MGAALLPLNLRRARSLHLRLRRPHRLHRRGLAGAARLRIQSSSTILVQRVLPLQVPLPDIAEAEAAINNCYCHPDSGKFE